MRSQSLAVLSTGGTIASTIEEKGARPTADGSDLTAAVPELAEFGEVLVETLEETLSFNIDFDTIAEMAERISGLEADGADGVVVTHGTDTMEESAYYLDLVLDTDIPVVLTGAQRRRDELGFDGYRNLWTAAKAASDERLDGKGGVYIAFDDELHAARDVTKGHSTAVATFVSPDYGPVAQLSDERFRFHRSPGSRSDSVEPMQTTKDVSMVKSGVDVGPRQVRHALADGVDGLVVEATGMGNTTAALGEAIEEAIADEIPVIVTTRCHSGRVAPVYGTPGGSERLRSSGALFAGDLAAHKARIKLMLLLEEVDAASDISQQSFEK